MASMYHEAEEDLPQSVRDCTRALLSLKEELEAIDWYNQRAAATENEELKSVVLHNRNEEMEHASMVLEWLRRNMDGWDEPLKTYLFTTAPITEIEEAGASGGSEGSESLGIGKMNR